MIMVYYPETFTPFRRSRLRPRLWQLMDVDEVVILCPGAIFQERVQISASRISKFSTAFIPPSHLFRISRNQAEPAGMKNFQNSCHIREGISNPVTLEAEWTGMTAEWKLFIYS